MATYPVFRKSHSGEEVAALTSTTVLKSSNAFGWRGLQVEEATSHGWIVDDVVVDGHYLAMNLSNSDLHFKILDELNWKSACLPPLSFWINPEGCPFSIHHNVSSYYATCFVNTSFLDDVAGRHIELEANSGLIDEVLARIVQALVALLHDPRLYSQQLADDLVYDFAYCLATRHGRPADKKGGLPPAQLTGLLRWLEDNLEGPLTVSTWPLVSGCPLRIFRESSSVRPD